MVMKNVTAITLTAAQNDMTTQRTEPFNSCMEVCNADKQKVLGRLDPFSSALNESSCNPLSVERLLSCKTSTKIIARGTSVIYYQRSA